MGGGCALQPGSLSSSTDYSLGLRLSFDIRRRRRRMVGGVLDIVMIASRCMIFARWGSVVTNQTAVVITTAATTNAPHQYRRVLVAVVASCQGHCSTTK